MGELSEPMVLALKAGHGVATTAQFRDRGVTVEALRWAASAGLLHRLHRGVYTAGSTWRSAGGTARHEIQVLAAQSIAPTSTAVGLSAARLLGLPVPRWLSMDPQLVTPRGEVPTSARGLRDGVRHRRAWLSDDDVMQLNGAWVTTPVRTVIDCCRELDDGWALAVADAAARFHGLTRAHVAERLLGTPVGPGRVRAAWVAEHLDPRSESPLESLNRAVLIRAGYDVEPQVWIDTDRGPYRVDLLDRGNRVISEADGRQKYEQEEEPATPWGDKLRQDALWDSGSEIVRFTMADYYSRRPDYLARYRRAVARADRR